MSSQLSGEPVERICRKLVVETLTESDFDSFPVFCWRDSLISILDTTCSLGNGLHVQTTEESLVLIHNFRYLHTD